MTGIDISEDVVAELGTTLLGATGQGALLSPSIRWDCSIGGLTFLFGMSDQTPMKRETGQFRRERVDNQRDPGEQSLDSGYWIRSQSSWHYGSGLTSAEPLEVNENEARFRYAQGGGVDVWTPGQVSLLKDTTQAFASTGSNQLMIGVDTGVLHADGTALTYVPTSGSNTTVTWGGSTAIASLTTNGDKWFATADAGIYKGSLPSGSGTKIYNTGAAALVRWVKSRLFAAVGASLYEITDLNPASPPASLPTALYTHPSANWTWTDFAEGPSAIYAAGYVGDTSVIYKIDVTATSTTTTLSQPVVVAELPRGEKVLNLYSYVGSYMVIGTSKGVRVATINNSYTASGTLTLGPIVVKCDDGCYDAVADNSFIYVTMGSKGQAGDRATRAGLYRLNLSTNLNQNPLLFANAADLVAPSGTTGEARQVTTVGGTIWFTVNGSGLYKQSTNYVAAGWVETGRIRLGTVESKAWRDVRVLAAEGGTGTVAAYAATYENGTPSTWDKVIELADQFYDQTGSLNATAPTPQANLFLAFKLIRSSTDAAKTPTFIGYQTRAIPAPRRSELLQVTMLCFDYELDRQGARSGNRGNSWARYELLKQMEKRASTVIWRDNTTGEASEVYIEQVSFSRTTPPTRNQSGMGGLVTVTMRLVG